MSGAADLDLPPFAGPSGETTERPRWSGERGPGRRGRLVILGAILLFAGAARLSGVLRFALEQDELYTLYESRDLFQTALEPGINARPFYYLLQHALLDLLPTSAFSLRLMPLVFGIAGVLVTWVAARRFFGTTAAVLAASAVAISPWHMHVSGMARYWSLVYLLGALYGYLLVISYRSDRIPHLLSTLGVLIVGAATHPSFLFTASGMALGISLVRRDGSLGFRWPSARAWAALWLPFLAFLAIAAAALRAGGNEESVRNWGSRGWMAGLRLVPAIVEWATPLVIAAGAVGAVVALGSSRDLTRRTWGAMAVTGGLSTVLLLAAAAQVTSVYADYATAMLPLVFVSLGGLAQIAADRFRGNVRIFTLVSTVLLLAAVSPSATSYLSDGTRFDYRPVFAHAERVAPQIPIVTWPLVLQQHYAPDLDGRELRVQRPYLDKLLADEGDLWLVASRRRYGYSWDDFGLFPRWLTEHCLLELVEEGARFDFRQYRVELYRCTAR